MPNGGFSIHTPGKPYEYVNPKGSGGYTEQTPQGPIYINPQWGGGYTATDPGTRTHVAMPSAPQYVPGLDDDTQQEEDDQ